MPKKFYAVRGGPTPGVYSSWDEAKRRGAQGIPGVQHKSFPTRAEAEQFVRGGAPPAAPQQHRAPPQQHRAPPASASASAAASTANGNGIRPGDLACFTDGACKGNNNVAVRDCPAGWGVAVVDGAVGDGSNGGE